MLKFFESLIAAFRLPSIDEVERDYLTTARDQTNLEYRQRQVERGLFRQPLNSQRSL